MDTVFCGRIGVFTDDVYADFVDNASPSRDIGPFLSVGGLPSEQVNIIHFAQLPPFLAELIVRILFLA